MAIRSSMPGLRVGLLGCGRIAQSVHVNVLTRLPRVSLVAIADADSERLETIGRHVPAARAFVDYRELIQSADVDAVVVCLPNSLHAEAAVAALQKGKHVYLEKPLATSLDEGQRVLETWRRAGVVGMMGFNYRFNPLYQALKVQYHSGRIGKGVGVRSIFSTAASILPTWKQTRGTGGGALLDLGSHHLDLVRFFFEKEVSEVSAVLRSERNGAESAALQMRLADGLLVQSFFSLNAVEEDRFEIYGESGKLTVDRYASLSVIATRRTQRLARLRRLKQGIGSPASVLYLVNKLRSPLHEPSYRAALACFGSAAQTGRPVNPDFGDGYQSLSVIVAAEKSISSGCVTVPEGNA